MKTHIMEKKKADRIGEKRMMNCGKEAEIIAYRAYDDIDVRFEDGTVITNRTYQSFMNGQIALPLKRRRVGEKRMMNCGMEAEIIAYRSYKDIDIRFEDGTVIENCKYLAFQKGTIKHPKKRREPKQKNERIGEKRMMNCGKEAEIIAYRAANDLDVRFEDGTIVTNRSYYSFQHGQIAPPPKSRVGEKRRMNCGKEAEIIAYRTYNDIDVRFEDGTIVTKRTYANFKLGRIAPPQRIYEPKQKDERIGEKRMMNCGKEAEIIAYRSYNDIDVRFEDGTVVTNRSYANFKLGRILPAKNTYKEEREAKRIGETRMMGNDLKATIIAYRGTSDVDIEFEDGVIVAHCAYDRFKKGLVTGRRERSVMQRLGETRVMKNGLKATIIAYRSRHDIDVQFEDGTIVYNKSYSNFEIGEIALQSKEDQKKAGSANRHSCCADFLRPSPNTKKLLISPFYLRMERLYIIAPTKISKMVRSHIQG